jgi:hypothetical protein
MTTQHKNQTPTQKIQTWIRDFVTQPNPVFGDLPPCPFAQKAIVEDKVAFVELDGVADYNTLYGHVFNFDFEDKDVLVMIAQPDQFSTPQTEQLAVDLNAYFMPKDIVILEDHPDTAESVKGVKLNNGHYILFLAQSLSKLNRFSKILEAGPYYKNWSRDYLQSVKGFRDRKNPKV